MNENNLFEKVNIEMEASLTAITERRKNSKERFSLLDALPRLHYEDLHSSFIAYLLNPKASHDCGSYFLDKFLKILNKDITKLNINCDSTKVNVITEYPLGNKIEEKINDKIQYFGGRIDILLNCYGRNIIIENKIYASDQENQLKRYKNFDNKALLLYLSPQGHKPSNFSVEDLKQNKDYYVISYKEHICMWLDECLEDEDLNENVKVRLSDYKQIIEKKILNMDTEMKDARVKVITDNIEILKHIGASEISKIRYDLRRSFLDTLKNKLDNNWVWSESCKETRLVDKCPPLGKDKYIGFSNQQVKCLISDKRYRFIIEANEELGLICGFLLHKNNKHSNMQLAATLNGRVGNSNINFEGTSNWVCVNLLDDILVENNDKRFYSDRHNYQYATSMNKLVDGVVEKVNVLLSKLNE